MIFDCLISNPPYQDESVGQNDSFTSPIYHKFLDAGFSVADKVMMIHPARFLFNAGGTPKEWNRKRLSDTHFKVVQYEPQSKDVFTNTDIKGGIAITYRDKDKSFGAIGAFASFAELNSIAKKVKDTEGFVGLNTVVYPASAYSLTDRLFKDYPDVHIVDRSNKNDKVGYHALSCNSIRTNAFDLLPDLFLDAKTNEDDVCILGRQNGRRAYKYISEKYVSVAGNYDKYKVIIPSSNGSGAIGEVLSTPIIGQPLIGHTQTFISIGRFDTESEGIACLKYIKTKFARAMLGMLKVTQHNPPNTWAFVPLQDFSDSSDIDWSVSISEIDRQLYRKYSLSQREIDFIEDKVEAMDGGDESHVEG